MNNTEKTVQFPQSIPTEKTVLGSIIIKPELYHEYASQITNKMWYGGPDNKHLLIWKAITSLMDNGIGLDLTTLIEELKSQNTLEKVEEWYISQLIEEVPTTENIKDHVDILKKKLDLRTIAETFYYAYAAAFEPGACPQAVISSTESKISNITNSDTSFERTELIGTSLEPVVHSIDLILQGNPPPGLKFHIKKIDDLLGMCQAAELIIVAARPSQGKTSLVFKMLLENALLGIPSLVFSLETSREKLIKRLLAMTAKVNLHKINNYPLNKGELERLNSVYSMIEKLPIYVNTISNPSKSKMRSEIKYHVEKYGVKILALDFLQLQEDDNGNNNNRALELAKYTRFYKEQAKIHELPFFALSQLNRGNVSHGAIPLKPQLANLRESGAIEQDADKVIFVHRESKYDCTPENQHVADIIVGKNKDGPTGETCISWYGEYVLFCD